MMTYGGFIGLEPALAHRSSLYPEACLLSSGRACLAYILDRLAPVHRAHVPFYTCDSALLPFRERSIELVFYAIGEDLLPRRTAAVETGDILMLNDLFGVLGASIEAHATGKPARVIYDDTHAFHAGRRAGDAWSFNSARKFFGVPDGAYLFASAPCVPPHVRNDRTSTDHLVLKSIGAHQAAYQCYQRNEERMSTAAERASHAGEELLARTDREASSSRRLANFKILQAHLGHLDRLRVTPQGNAPYCYPFWPATDSPVNRELFHAAGIFVPTLWKDVIDRPAPEGTFAFEKRLSRELLPLPIDQRYTEADMHDLAHLVLTLLGST